MSFKSKGTVTPPITSRSTLASRRISGDYTKRQSGEEVTRYEHPLPFNLDDFMNYYTAPAGTVPYWAQPLVNTFATTIQDMIRHHWPNSSKTRLLFSTMNTELIWEDEATKTMKLNKRNLATLDPGFQPELQKYVLDQMSDKIETLRRKILQSLAATYAPSLQRSEIERQVGGKEETDYSFDRYHYHLDLAQVMVAELKRKYAVVEFARLREIFHWHLCDWEQNKRKDIQDKAKGSTDMHNWLPKFQLDLAKKYAEANTTMEKMIHDYEASEAPSALTVRVQFPAKFSLNDTDYNSVFATQLSRISLVKTNFTHLSKDDLWFLQDGNILQREIGPDVKIEVAQKDATPLPAAPLMPVYAKECEFTFEYDITPKPWK